MKISLNNFEHDVPETILKRGLQYFKGGKVHEPEEISNNEFETIVEGSEDYTVNFTLKNNEITDYVCSCPYDHGPICKHIVAVIFYLKQDELGLNKTTKRRSSSPKPKEKKPTVSDKLNEILDKLSEDDLKAYIKEMCIKDNAFRQKFFSQHISLVMAESKALYTSQIKAILNAIKGRKGYIDYHDATEVYHAVNDLITKANQNLNHQNYLSAFFIATAILEEMTDAIGYADDSNGDIGSCIESATDILNTLTRSKLPEKVRKELFEYCVAAFKDQIFQGWDWHFSMIDIAIELAENKAEAITINTLLDGVKPKKDDWDWDYRQIQDARLELIKKFEGEDAAIDYLEQHLDNSDFRKEAIETAISAKNYQKAIHLASEGIKNDEKRYPGLAQEWRILLLGVYQKQKDTDNIVKTARYIFLKDNVEKEKMFALLKQTVAKEKWEEFCNQLIKEIRGQSQWFNLHIVANIYVWEKRWADLLKILKEDVSLHTLDNYSKYLEKEYPDIILTMYKEALLIDLEHTGGRSQYKDACRYLRRMKKMGGNNIVNEIINQLRAKYPNRRALMEELERV